MVPETMTAAVMYAPGDIRVEGVNVASPGPAEVLLKVAACGVCGSDIPRMLRNGGYVMPIICGHEFSGYVEQLGEGVTGFELGDLVSVPPLIPCYHCDFCLRGEFGLCENYDYFGSRSNGAYAQYVVSPVGNLLKMPAGIDPRAAAMLDPAAIALHALWKTGLRSGHRVLVVGAGPIGLFAVQWAKPAGAGQIVTVDLSAEKSAMAREAGATGAVQTHDEAKALAGRGFDIVLESAGVPVTADMAAHLTGPQGHAVFVGIPHAPVTLSKETFNQFMRLEVTLHGSWNSFSAPFPGDEWRTAADKLANGELKWEFMITHELPLSELPAMHGQARRPFRVHVQSDLSAEPGLRMGILLSIDLGTEGARVGAFTEDGVSLGSVHRPYRTTFPRPGWAEQDPETWWTAFVDAARTLRRRRMHAVPPDRWWHSPRQPPRPQWPSSTRWEGRCGQPCSGWIRVPLAQAERTAQHAETHTILAWSGGSDAAEWLLPKAIWLKENEPAVYRSSARIVEAIDYLTFRLTGRWVGSQMNAVCKYNYDTINRRFPMELYDALGIGDLGTKAARPDPARRFRRRHPHLGGGRRTRHRRRRTCRSWRHRCPRVAAGLRCVHGWRGLARLGYVVGNHRRGGLTRADDRGVGSLSTGAASLEVARRGWPDHERPVLKWAGETIMGVARDDLASLIKGATAVEPGAHGVRPRYLHGQPHAVPRRSPARGGGRSDTWHDPRGAVPVGRGSRRVRNQGRHRLVRACRGGLRPTGLLRGHCQQLAVAASHRRCAGP